MTLENIDDADRILSKIPVYTGFPVISSNHAARFNISLVEKEVRDSMFGQSFNAFEIALKDEYRNEITLFIQELRDKIPSKRAELEEAEHQRKALQAAKEAATKAKTEAEREAAIVEAEAIRFEQERIEAERSAREAAENARIAAEQEAASVRAEQDAAMKANAATVNAMMDNATELFSETPEVKTGYKITVTSTAAYLNLAMFWYEHEGKKMTVDKLEKVTFDRIRRFCEEHAVKNEEFIDNKMIVYEEIYKAK